MRTGWLWCGRAGITSAMLGGNWTKVLLHSEGPAVGSATLERNIVRHHVSFSCQAEDINFCSRWFPPAKQTVFSSGAVEGDGLFSIVSGVPGHRNELKAGHTEVTYQPCGPL